MLLYNHVLESNLIEGVANEGPLLQNHLLAARCVELAAEKDDLLHPCVLHAILFYGEILPLNHIPGNYRHCEAKVGSYHPPNHDFIYGYMDDWWDVAFDDDPWSSHCYFEAIHPFVDGNGRVGRLVYWNQQLIAKQEPEIILAKEKWDYYERLEQWREINWREIVGVTEIG